ncbi:MAG: DNA adenine methylase [Desulfurellales bacterium]|nr:MAG: DNA adenine methylase [Desulfurellales bacterium]
MSDKPLRAPFPWFGGKSRAASLIWSRIGDVSNYVEPFAGSLAVLLARPHEPGTETVNDLDCYVANFWRAVAHAPDEVARWCDWPVNEADLHARHRWLIEVMPWHRERIMTDPDYFDAKIAGWWVWGICQWIGSGWCRDLHHKRPVIGTHAGRGVHAVGFNRDIFESLRCRLRSTRICSGDWTRVLGEGSIGISDGVVTGIVLDPPYDPALREPGLYREDIWDISRKVREWAVSHGHHRGLRIALCGYENEHYMPSDWESISWSSNAQKERIWFSPSCLKPNRHDDLPLFKETT